MNKERQPKNNAQEKTSLEKLFYFFPLQLLIVHLKKNQQLLLFWLILFLILFGELGVKYGIPLLFYAPEYLGQLSLWSYGILGLSFGGFVMAFNIASYIMNGFRFPFLATLSKPFLKYCINNSLLPLIYLICYSVLTFNFLDANENFETVGIFFRIGSFYLGYSIFVTISLSYFLATNKDFEKLFGKEIGNLISSDNSEEEPAKALLQKSNKSWFKENVNTKAWRVESYIGSKFRLKSTRYHGHYDQKMLSQVFRQNHINASFFEIATIISILLLGQFNDIDFVIIPAAASFFLLITMLLMTVSAIRSWIRGWTIVVLLLLLIGLNLLTKFENSYFESKVLGLNYSKEVDYIEYLKSNDYEKVKKDSLHHIKILENWKNKINTKYKTEKPKAIFVAASGGGSRAALWSLLSLQYLDSITNGQLFDQTILISGSSGGMIGSSYYRELHLHKDAINPYSSSYQEDMGRDLLNPLFFNLVVNDMFIRTNTIEINGENHWKDRGYVFEECLLNNSDNFFKKSLADYQIIEENANAPMIIYTPSILNDSRRLLISSQPISFLSKEKYNYALNNIENVEYRNLIGEVEADKTRFTSVLRMTASFPYIMPSITLPTIPRIEVFDSGLRDNYGIKTTLQYIHVFNEWFTENTSGIIIIQLRKGKNNIDDMSQYQRKGLASNLLSPFGSLYGNLFQIQDFNNGELLSYAQSWHKNSIELLPLEINRKEKENISLSWHLTSVEKDRIKESIHSTNNQENVRIIKSRLKTP